MKTRKKGLLFFAVVAFIMLSSAVMLAVNPGQWFGDALPVGDFVLPSEEELDAF